MSPFLILMGLDVRLRSTTGCLFLCEGLTAALCTMYATSLSRCRFSIVPVMSSRFCRLVICEVSANSEKGGMVTDLTALVGWYSGCGSEVYLIVD